MISNVWEEQQMDHNIYAFHESELQKMSLPSWTNISCPYCNKPLSLRSIRTIAMRLNTRNMGDLTIEFFCDDCSIMDTLYFKKEIKDVSDFIALLSGTTSPSSKALLEQDMYKQQYNNVVEKMVKGE